MELILTARTVDIPIHGDSVLLNYSVGIPDYVCTIVELSMMFPIS